MSAHRYSPTLLCVRGAVQVAQLGVVLDVLWKDYSVITLRVSVCRAASTQQLQNLYDSLKTDKNCCEMMKREV